MSPMIMLEDRLVDARRRTFRNLSPSPRVRLPLYQTRTCVRCGSHTTFVLEDPRGGWYLCSECGAYA